MEQLRRLSMAIAALKLKWVLSLRVRLIQPAVILFCSAFTPAWANQPDQSFQAMLSQVELAHDRIYESDTLKKIREVVEYIKKMQLQKAQLAANEALQLDPRNSYIHFLNGFIYHLQAIQGDTQKGELAVEGYQQSLRIDPGNWISQEFLGLAYTDLKLFKKAKEAFSEALLLNPDTKPSMNGLMVTAYLTGDARTGCDMASQLLKVSDRPSQTFLQSSVLVYAACGQFDRANWIRAALAQEFGESTQLKAIDRRLAQWQNFYSDHQQSAAEMLHAKIMAGYENKPKLILAKANDVNSSEDSDDEDFDEEEQSDDSGESVDEPTLSATEVVTGPRTLMVDVVMLSTQELMSTSRGVNLLSALTLQLGSVAENLPAYSKAITSNKTDDTPTTTSTVITRAVTIPALSYSMNIANANNSVNEVLARPTLTALEGMPSEFFSGTNLSAGIVSISEEGGTTIVPLEKRFGINLAITPNFLSDGRVQLKVEAQRTALNASTENPRAAYQIEIGETTANANVVMNVGETLVLSGLSEKSSSSTRDGVPGLQRIPLLQYLFSTKKENQLQRSVLILVTPKDPVMLAKAELDVTKDMTQQMQQLRKKYGLDEKMPENIEAVLADLQNNAHFREFRQSDVSIENWSHMSTTGERLKEVLSFLYY